MNRIVCIGVTILSILMPCAYADSAAEAVLVGLTEKEQKSIRDTQSRILKEAGGDLLQHLQAKSEKPRYPLSKLVALVGGEPAVAKLARLLNDPRFQTKSAHIQILYALEQLQIDGAGKQIAAIARQGIYKEDASMLAFVVAAFSPAEVTRYAKDLTPYLRHENAVLRALVAYRLAAAGVEEGKEEFCRLIVNPDRYVEMTVMNRLTYCDQQLGLLVLDSLGKAETDESKRLVAHIVLASGVRDRPKALQTIIEKMQVRTKPMPIMGSRKTRAATAAIQSLLAHEKYRGWMAQDEGPLLFSIEDVGTDFRVPGKRIRLVRYAHIQILGLQDKCLSIRALDNGQDSILVSVGFGPIIKRSTIEVTLKDENGEHKVVSIEHHPG